MLTSSCEVAVPLLPTSGIDTAVTTHGYTGHEMLDQVGLIHMNGRIYDARLARFLQADPFIQYPDFSQSYNRYSYVLNNPLNAIDPSGYFSLATVMDVFVVVVAVVMEIACSGCGAGFEMAVWYFSGPSGVAHAAEAGFFAFTSGNYGAAALYIAAAYFGTTGIKGAPGAGARGAGIASASGAGTASGMTNGKFANAAYTGSALSALNAKEGPMGGDTDLSGYALFAYLAAGLLDEDKKGRRKDLSVGARNSRAPIAKQKSGYGWTEIDGHHIAYFGEDVISDGIADLKAINDLSSLPYSNGEELLVYRSGSHGEVYLSRVLSSNGDQVSGTVSSSDLMVAVAHTHPLYTRRDAGAAYTRLNRLNENFGPGDHHNIVVNQRPNYLRTPSGVIKVLEARSGRLTVRTLTGGNAGDIELWVRRMDQ